MCWKRLIEEREKNNKMDTKKSFKHLAEERIESTPPDFHRNHILKNSFPQLQALVTGVVITFQNRIKQVQTYTFVLME
jgi:hypothetical protein